MDIDLHQKHEVEKILVLFTEKLSEKWEVRWRNREEGGRWMRGEGEWGGRIYELIFAFVVKHRTEIPVKAAIAVGKKS